MIRVWHLWSILWWSCLYSGESFTTARHCRTKFVPSTSSSRLHDQKKDRENEIRRKIAQLKKQKSNDDSSTDDYARKIRQRLGKAKSKMLGFDVDDYDDDLDVTMDTMEDSRRGRLGTLPVTEDDTSSLSSSPNGGYIPPRNDPRQQYFKIDSTLFADENDEDAMPEKELIDLVEQRMRAKRERERREREEQRLEQAREEQEAKITSGVGGSWSKNETTTKQEELYQPKSGSWGAFPRPRDISKAYGGGRRVGAGFTEEERMASEEDTRARLQRYREKVGIEVQSEKDHAAEIDEALRLSNYAMQRGVYSTAVSVLEKVTKYCSSNSKVGGQVFLELGMAYEANGQTQEAIKVYQALTQCRIEKIKLDAKRLLYGIEAMEFMRNDVGDANFSRRQAKNTFIDTTGFGNIASNFDNVYNTAYVDLEGGFYRRLTESVVRSSREARQILLKATDAGEVGRLRIVQALRSISRRFDDALMEEIESNTVKEPVAVIDGKPLIVSKEQSPLGSSSLLDEFNLAPVDQMCENLDGEWRLQLLADKKGDGVKFFNSTLSWQAIDMSDRRFDSMTPSAFCTLKQEGSLEFDVERRILSRVGVESSGGGVLTGFLDRAQNGPVGAVRLPQQILSVDSVLLITRGVASARSRDDDIKDYFAVWRRVDRGTYCEAEKSDRTR